MGQEEKPRVCAHCKLPFSAGWSFPKEYMRSELAHGTRLEGEGAFASIDRIVASMGEGVYYDAEERQWNLENMHYFNVVRYYHAECIESAQSRQADQLVAQARGKIESLLRQVGFDEATVQIVPPPEHLVRAAGQSLIEDSDALFRFKQIRCLQVTASLGNFFIYFADTEYPPVIDLQGTGISGGEVFMRLLKKVYAISPEGEKAQVFPEAVFLHGGLFMPHPISLDLHNLLSLTALRQTLYELQRAKT